MRGGPGISKTTKIGRMSALQRYTTTLRTEPSCKSVPQGNAEHPTNIPFQIWQQGHACTCTCVNTAKYERAHPFPTCPHLQGFLLTSPPTLANCVDFVPYLTFEPDYILQTHLFTHHTFSNTCTDTPCHTRHTQ